MSERNFFRTICYAVIGLACLGGGFSIMVGVKGIMEEQPFIPYFVLVGVLVPLFVFLFVYCMLAIANIDEKVERLTAQIEKLIEIRLDESIVSDADDCEDEETEADYIVK